MVTRYVTYLSQVAAGNYSAELEVGDLDEDFMLRYLEGTRLGSEQSDPAKPAGTEVPR